MRLACFCLALIFSAAPVRADVPNVVSDIAPVQSLVATVMQGVGMSGLIVTGASSPHGFALRPSQAGALQAADLVVWIGPELTPWLGTSIQALAPDAQKLELLQAAGTGLLAFRAGDAKDHDHDAQSGSDPHAWLDPENGRVWLGLIAGVLAGMDPANADRYHANALAGQADLARLRRELEVGLVAMQGKPYVTFHDAYQYFEARFGLTPIGAVTASDGGNPGPAGLAQLRDELTGAGVVCAFSEPRFDPGLLRVAVGRDDLKVIALDPMGSRQDPGPALYNNLLREMGRAFASCGDLK